MPTATLRSDLERIDRNPSFTTDLTNGLDLQTPAAKEFLRFSLANVLLFDRKQLDYGPRNIEAFGAFGCLVRMTDKFERLKTLWSNGRRRKAVNESISDTFRDIHNYANIALMLEQGKWPMK